MCDKIVSEDPFKLKYCHDKYKTYEMCNKTVDDFLPISIFVLDWFVTINWFLTALHADNNIL